MANIGDIRPLNAVQRFKQMFVQIFKSPAQKLEELAKRIARQKDRASYHAGRRSRYEESGHGARECARRRRQIQAGTLRVG